MASSKAGKDRQKVNCNLPINLASAIELEAAAQGIAVNKLIGQTMWKAMQEAGRLSNDVPYPKDGRGGAMREYAAWKREQQANQGDNDDE